MKKIILIITMILLGSTSVLAGNTWDDDSKKLYSQDESRVLNSDGLDDPIAGGTLSTAKGMQGIAKIDNLTLEGKQRGFMDYIAIFVNYLLAFLGLVVIILIIRDGIIMIGSAGDDGKKKEAFTNLKNYILAIIFIGAAYLIVNLAFNFVGVNTK